MGTHRLVLRFLVLALLVAAKFAPQAPPSGATSPIDAAQVSGTAPALAGHEREVRGRG